MTPCGDVHWETVGPGGVGGKEGKRECALVPSQIISTEVVDTENSNTNARKSIKMGN